MVLTTAGKNWLASNAGVNDCFSPTGVTFFDADGVQWIAGTKDVVTSFVGAHMANKNDVKIVANTSYNEFKLINGGDIGFADVTFVYNSDGHTLPTPATLPLYCGPAHVISATLTVDTNDCVAPCTVHGTVSWTNNGGTASSPTDLSISYNGNSIPVASSVVIGPGETLPYTFSIPGLAAGTYIVQAYPNAGTSPQTVIVRTPANIISTALTISANTCTELCIGITGSVSWTNNGGVASSPIDLSISYNGNSISAASAVTINPGQILSYTFTLPSLTAGTYQICASPGTHCQTLVVQQIRAHFTSTPSGATVYVDGNIQPEVTPTTVIGLTAGTHTYRMTHPDCSSNEITGSFTTVVGEITEIPVIFDTKVYITSTPSGARIWIDNYNKGVNTPSAIVVTAGHHTYKLTKSGYMNFIGGFDITACQHLTIPIANMIKAKEEGIGPLLMGGLIIGALLFGKKECKEGYELVQIKGKDRCIKKE